jgi:predicted DsbA family dithiol-disulfide isomerase
VRIERLRQAFDIEVRFVHFPLHPETPPEGQTLAQLFAGRRFDIVAAQAQMKTLMAAESLPYGERTMTYNSRLAQEMAMWAQGQLPNGTFIHEALFRAYFVDNLNIAEVDNLVAIAEKAGLPPVAAREVLQTRRFRATVHADWEHSRQQGVTAVPTFRMGGREVAGAQTYEILEQLVLNSGASGRYHTRASPV